MAESENNCGESITNEKGDSGTAIECKRLLCGHNETTENHDTILMTPTAEVSVTSPQASGPSQSALSAEQDGGKSISSRPEEDNQLKPEKGGDMAPDGGWGWVVCFGSFAINFMLDGTMLSFGVLMLELVSDLRQDKSTVSWIGSLQMGIHMIMGPVISVLLQTYSIRQVVLLGSIIAACAFIVSVFAPHIFVLIFTYGIVVGIGFGFVYMPSLIILVPYFNRRRAIATGIATSGSGLGVFAYAWITDLLLEHFNWRGTVLILGGLMLNCLVFGSLFRPLSKRKSKELNVQNNCYGDKEQDNAERVKLIPKENCKPTEESRESEPMMALQDGGQACVTTEIISMPTAKVSSCQHECVKYDPPQTPRNDKFCDPAERELFAQKNVISDGITNIPIITQSPPSLEVLYDPEFDPRIHSSAMKTLENLNNGHSASFSNCSDFSQDTASLKLSKPSKPSSSSDISPMQRDGIIRSTCNEKGKSSIHDIDPTGNSTSLTVEQAVGCDSKSLCVSTKIDEPASSGSHTENIKQNTENRTLNGFDQLQHFRDLNSDTLRQSRAYSRSADQLHDTLQPRPATSRKGRKNGKSGSSNSHLHPTYNHALSPLSANHGTAELGKSQTLSLYGTKGSSLHPRHRDKYHGDSSHHHCLSLDGSRMKIVDHPNNSLSSHHQSKSSQHLAADYYYGSLASFGVAMPHAEYSTDNNDVTSVNANRKGCHSCHFYFNKFFPLRLLKDVQFLLMLLGFVMWTSLFITMTYLPAYAVSLGIERTQAAFLISIIGIANVLGRPMAGFMTDCLSVSSIWLYTCALALAAIMNFAIPFCISYLHLAVCSGVFGLCMGCSGGNDQHSNCCHCNHTENCRPQSSQGPTPVALVMIIICTICKFTVVVSMRTIVLADQMGVDVLTESFGLVALFQGIAFIVLPPVAGTMIERFESSRPSFWLVSGMYTVSATAMLSAACVSRGRASSEGSGVKE